MLPGVLVFSLGLAATVAPLTATVLDSVEERHVGIASGVNNGISRVAGLLAIAVLGAVIAASFGSDRANRAAGRSAGRVGVSEAKDSRWRCPTATAAAAERRGALAAADASTAFHLGIAIAGLLMIAGGVVAGFGIVNPKRRSRRCRPAARPRPASAATAPSATQSRTNARTRSA